MDFSAVLVGINKYSGAPLRGCVNDVIIMRDILVKKFHIPAADLRLVLDERARKQDILERLEWLVTNPAPHKFFHYSGHGAQIPIRHYDKDDIEPDRMDELICPYDFDWQGTYITDDQIHDILAKLSPAHHLTMVFDCCHSGTITRDLGGLGGSSGPAIVTGYESIGRSIEAPLDLLSRMSSTNLSNSILEQDAGAGFFDLDDAFFDLKEEVKPPKIKSLVSNPNISVLTGCSDAQTSADAWFSSRFQGALSYVMQGILIKQPTISMMDLHEVVLTKLQRYNFSQTPQLNGPSKNWSKPFIQV